MNNETTVIIEDLGRKLIFRIRLMSALKMEQWLERAARILPQDEVQKLEGSPTAVAAFILQRGFVGLFCDDEQQTFSLLDDLLECCSIVNQETGETSPCSAKNLDANVIDARTLLKLRKASLDANLAFALKGARKPLFLPRESSFRRSVAEQTFAKTANMPQITACLINQGMASLSELRGSYTFSEALDLLEVLNVRNYNQWASMESAKRKGRR